MARPEARRAAAGAAAFILILGFVNCLRWGSLLGFVLGTAALGVGEGHWQPATWYGVLVLGLVLTCRAAQRFPPARRNFTAIALALAGPWVGALGLGYFVLDGRSKGVIHLVVGALLALGTVTLGLYSLGGPHWAEPTSITLFVLYVLLAIEGLFGAVTRSLRQVHGHPYAGVV